MTLVHSFAGQAGAVLLTFITFFLLGSHGLIVRVSLGQRAGEDHQKIHHRAGQERLHWWVMMRHEQPASAGFLLTSVWSCRARHRRSRSRHEHRGEGDVLDRRHLRHHHGPLCELLWSPSCSWLTWVASKLKLLHRPYWCWWVFGCRSLWKL